MMMNSGLAEISKLTGNGLGGTKFDAVAIGSGTTAAAATQTALTTEITTNGGSRRSGADVTATLVTTTVTNDTIRFDTTYSFTGTLAINEIGVFNAPSGGVMLLRQVFANPLNVVNQDQLQLLIDVKSSDQALAANSRITNAGIIEGNKLIATDLTPASGRLVAIALGQDNGTILALNATNTTLGDEIVVADNVGLARGQETSGPTVTNTTTNVTNDTVTIDSTWVVVNSSITVNEVGSFTSTSPSSGIMFVRYVFASPLNLIPTDTFRMIMRLVQVS